MALAAVVAPAADAAERERYLVHFKLTPGAEERAAVEAARIRHEFPIVEAMAGLHAARACRTLADDPTVERVEPDRVVSAQAVDPRALRVAELQPDLGNGLYGLITTRATMSTPRSG